MLRERIIQTLEKQANIDQRKLARVAGLSESSISRYLHGHEEINFESVLRLVKYLYPDEEVEIMAEYVLTQKSRNARFGMEYCVMNKLHDELNVLIENLAEAVNPLDKEWAAMYELIREKRESDISPYELLKKVEVFRPKELEMQILKSIVKGYIYFDMNEHEALYIHVKHAEEDIKQIKSTFIRDSFKVRLGLLMSTVHLYANDLEKSRYYSYAVLGQDFFEYVKGTAYFQLGYTYMFEDYQAADKYFTNALNLSIEQQNSVLISKIKLDTAFLNSYWQLNDEFTLSLDEKNILLNYIYHLIQKGDTSLASNLMLELEEEKLSEWLKGFYWYYQGLLNKDTKAFYRSVELFIQMKDYFHLTLPIEELRKLGENEDALKILSEKGNLNNEKVHTSE